MDVSLKKMQENWCYAVETGMKPIISFPIQFIANARQHLAQNDEGYYEHLLFAAKHAFILMYAGFALLIHAFIPCLHMTTASSTVRKLYHRFSTRGAVTTTMKSDESTYTPEQYYI